MEEPTTLPESWDPGCLHLLSLAMAFNLPLMISLQGSELTIQVKAMDRSGPRPTTQAGSSKRLRDNIPGWPLWQREPDEQFHVCFLWTGHVEPEWRSLADNWIEASCNALSVSIHLSYKSPSTPCKSDAYLVCNSHYYPGASWLH